MMNLLINIKPELVDILMLRCDDNENRDFEKEIYEECIFRAYKKIARDYNILSYVLTFQNIIPIPPDAPEDYLNEKLGEDIDLPIKYFRGESKVIINNRRYIKAENNSVGNYEYHLYRGVDSWKFNYSPRSESDEVIIHYQGDIELEAFEDERTMPVIPAKYEDELIKYSLVEISKLGISKFKAEKREKYKGIFTLNSRNGIDPNVAENIDFRIKPMKFP